jgi:hypothetical protein
MPLLRKDNNGQPNQDEVNFKEIKKICLQVILRVDFLYIFARLKKQQGPVKPAVFEGKFS